MSGPGAAPDVRVSDAVEPVAAGRRMAWSEILATLPEFMRARVAHGAASPGRRGELLWASYGVTEHELRQALRLRFVSRHPDVPSAVRLLASRGMADIDAHPARLSFYDRLVGEHLASLGVQVPMPSQLWATLHDEDPWPGGASARERRLRRLWRDLVWLREGLPDVGSMPQRQRDVIRAVLNECEGLLEAS